MVKRSASRAERSYIELQKTDFHNRVVHGLVSVVTPVRYVNRKWLAKSISSALSQDYPKLELIVVNDDSTEDIDGMVESFGIKKYIKNDQNRGAAYSFNRGFEVSEGEPDWEEQEEIEEFHEALMVVYNSVMLYFSR